jgi:hypothetical protein
MISYYKLLDYFSLLSVFSHGKVYFKFSVILASKFLPLPFIKFIHTVIKIIMHLWIEIQMKKVALIDDIH